MTHFEFNHEFAKRYNSLSREGVEGKELSYECPKCGDVVYLEVNLEEHLSNLTFTCPHDDCNATMYSNYDSEDEEDSEEEDVQMAPTTVPNIQP